MRRGRKKAHCVKPSFDVRCGGAGSPSAAPGAVMAGAGAVGERDALLQSLSQQPHCRRVPTAVKTAASSARLQSLSLNF